MCVCWIRSVSILLGIFAYILISDIGLQFSFFLCVVSLSAFGIRVMVASQNEFGHVPSSAVFWNSFGKINVTLF